jgi:lipid-A-disaccharide synthase-like uncharacterized protein
MKKFKYSLSYVAIIILIPILVFLINEFLYNNLLYPLFGLALFGLYLISFGGIIVLLSRKSQINPLDFWIALILGSVIVLIPVVYLITAFIS